MPSRWSEVVRWLRVSTIRVGALLLVLAALQYVFNVDSRSRREQLQEDVERMQAVADGLESQNERLRMKVSGIRHDDRYLEQVAREEFGMIRKGEVLYQFPEPKDRAPVGTLPAPPTVTP